MRYQTLPAIRPPHLNVDEFAALRAWWTRRKAGKEARQFSGTGTDTPLEGWARRVRY